MSSASSNAAPQKAPAMTAQSLMAQAAAEEGLDDFGDTGFVAALEQLIASVSEEANLVEPGLMGFGMGIVTHLRNRLRFQDDLKRHPEILGEDVSDPIIITGLSRTGTTKLQRIMAADTQTQKLLLWQCMNPAPFKGSKGVDPDPRIAAAKANAEAFRQISPDSISAHSMGAEIPEEDSMLFQATFESSTEGYFYRVPGYMSWLWNQRPLHDAYAYFKSLVQYLQWQDGGRRGRPWVLKGTPHLGLLDEVLTAFPKATIIQCHRDPAVAIPSLCRLNEALRTARGSHKVDLREMGEFFAAYGPAMWNRQLEQLSRLRSRANIIDVHYDRIRDDAINVVREIYHSRGMTLSAEAEQAMVRWEMQNPQHKEGKHSYTLEHFGLSEKSIAEGFKAYFEYFPAATSR